MENLFPLALFPEASLSSSVITTVWLGVLVVAFFNLRFGWLLTGLVVPGYLVPLLLIKPWAVVAIFVEGVTAYYLVWLFSEYFSRYGLWSALFGRDRFFALILASIATRVVFDGWALPWVGLWLEDYGVVFDYRNELHSLGLVIVALVANQFWKTGFIAGLTPFAITLFITWALVKYLLIPYTNFGLGGLSYMYEDIAASILASPKAYIILVTTAFVASRMNLRYGWDFNGILIPALLALQWYQPSKILISFGEAFIILGIATLTLKLPIFANASIEGARKLLLFFNISFIYKMLLSFILLHFAEQVKVSDFFAFGYLLSTLMAIKMHDKGILIRLTRATVQTSVVSIVVASIIGFLLTIVPQFQPWTMPFQTMQNQKNWVVNEPLLERILSLKPELYRTRYDEISNPLPQEVDAFVKGSYQLLEHSRNKDPELLKQGINNLSQLGYQVELLENQYLLIYQPINSRNWGVFVINLQAKDELLLELPIPLKTRGLLEGVAALFVNLNARSLSIAGGSIEAYRNQSIFDAFHRLAGRRDVLQVNSYTKEIQRALAASAKTNEPKDLNAEALNSANTIGELWVKKRLPPSLELAKLEKVVGKYHIQWGEIEYLNQQRDASREGFAELIINQTGLRRLLIGSILSQSKTTETIGQQRIAGYLQEWLLGKKGQIAESGTNQYQVPKAEELIYMDEEVLTPLINLIKNGYQQGQWRAESLLELQIINIAARVFGYEIIRYSNTESGNDYLILSESNQQLRRFWGTYVFRLGDSSPYVLQSPRPLYEVNSFEVAVSMFERIQANALLIGGTHPLTNQDHSSDLVRSENQVSLFSLVNQVLMRESSPSPLMAVQCRALGQQFNQPLPDADMLVSFDDGAVHQQSFNPLQKQLYQTLKADNWQLQLVDGTLQTSGYQVGGTPQARYVNASENKGFALLWVSPLVRSSFKQQRQYDSLSIQFQALNIPSVEGDLLQQTSAIAKASSQTLPVQMLQLLTRYQETLDIQLLKKMYLLDSKLNRIIDTHSKQAFLLIHNSKGELTTLANLNPVKVTSRQIISIDQFEREKINEFIETRVARLELTDK